MLTAHSSLWRLLGGFVNTHRLGATLPQRVSPSRYHRTFKVNVCRFSRHSISPFTGTATSTYRLPQTHNCRYLHALSRLMSHTITTAEQALNNYWPISIRYNYLHEMIWQCQYSHQGNSWRKLFLSKEPLNAITLAEKHLKPRARFSLCQWVFPVRVSQHWLWSSSIERLGLSLALGSLSL